MSSHEDPTNSQNGLRARKDEHLEVVAANDVASITDSGWKEIRLPHRAAPEMNLDEVRIDTEFLGQRLRAPLLISSMTGGTPSGETLNRRLAVFAERRGFAMGVGSQRVQLGSGDDALFALRRAAPRAVLYSNLGLVQLNYGKSVDDCRRIVDRLEANALILHLNPLQEAIQLEGDRDFAGLWKKATELRRELRIPLILKEVGCGLDADTCRRAREVGFDAVDVAGLGGTHWGYIEGLRSPSRRRLGELFRDWGIPTREALHDARAVLPRDYPVIASGGIRDGLEAAKAIYAGADLVGLAAPFLRAAHSEESLEAFGDEITETLRIAHFATGCRTPRDLRELGPSESKREVK